MRSCRAIRSRRRRISTSPRTRSRAVACFTARSSWARGARRSTASTCTWGSSSAAARSRCARICARIRETVPQDAPLVIAGDFNDWRHKANQALVDELGVHEVFESVRGRPARTFPSVHAGVPTRPHLRPRSRDPRRPRPLHDTGPVGACPTTRRSRPPSTPPGERDDPLRPGQPRRASAQRRRVLSGARAAQSTARTRKSGSRPTSLPTTMPAASSRPHSCARPRAASPCE